MYTPEETCEMRLEITKKKIEVLTKERDEALARVDQLTKKGCNVPLDQNWCAMEEALREKLKQLAAYEAVVDAARKLRINCSPSMNGKHIYTVNIGGTNNKALGELQRAVYELEKLNEKE